jgi:hypothetical protein
MSKTFFLTFNAFFLTLALSANYKKNLPKIINEHPSINSIAFTENKGQVHDQNYNPRPDVLFGAMAGGLAFHLKTSGVSYQLKRIDSYNEIDITKSNALELLKSKRREIEKQTIYRIDLNWLNHNINFTVTKDEELPGYNNYNLESCPNGALNVKSYKGVTLHNLYKNIDLHYYEKNGQIKHDYIVASYTDYKQIQIKIAGADIQVKSDGGLILRTPLGKVEEGKPIVYQNGKELKAKWIIKNNTVSFDVENYNPKYELIIDPVTRIWGTYYGTPGIESAEDCCTDANGNVYLVGFTNAITSTVLATVGSHQQSSGGWNDGILVKFDALGVRQWATFYGAIGAEVISGCVTDALGNIYITGESNSAISTSVIATAGSHQQNFGGVRDAFLVKFNSSGVRQWGTYYGGAGDDWGKCCAIDASGNIYLVGTSSSTTGVQIASSGSHQDIYGGGGQDAFIAKFSSAGVRQWATYYGGVGSDFGEACSVDGSGNVYLGGLTDSNSPGVIATVGSHQVNYGGGLQDAFLVKFNSSGVRQWGTYYGGAGSDGITSIKNDNIGNIYFVGITTTNFGNWIATNGSHQTIFGGNYDAYLAKLNSNGVRQWGTYYGGVGNDYGISCSLDQSGNVFFAGYTATSNGTIIATTGSYQNIFGGDYWDAYLVKFNGNGTRQWGTYYGGSAIEVGYGCVVDLNGYIYLCGNSTSSVGIATPGSYQSIISAGGDYDTYLVKFNGCPALGVSANVNNSVCAGSTLSFSGAVSSTLAVNYNWVGPNSFTSNVQNPNINNASTIHSGIYTLTVNDGNGCS